jgi:hypothetical protein
MNLNINVIVHVHVHVDLMALLASDCMRDDSVATNACVALDELCAGHTHDTREIFGALGACAGIQYICIGPFLSL